MKEFELNCTWGNTFIRKWNCDSPQTPILALHGWLDNSASFTALADHLNAPIIAIDLPGHGYSSHLADGNWYHFVDYAVRLNEVIQKLHLEKFHLMGHSMGAGIGVLYSATFPEQVDTLILLDGAGPMINEAEDAPAILRRSILSRNKPPRRHRLLDLNTAIKLRMIGGQISRASAEILVKGQIRPQDKKFVWSYDEKINFVSPLRLSPAQLGAFLQKVSCPTLLIKASEGIIEKSTYKSIVRQIPKLKVETITGYHHIHMEKSEEVSQVIINFLNMS